MGRETAKLWGKREAIKVLVQINDELAKVIKGRDPRVAVANIESLICKLKKIETPPKTIAESSEKRTLLPGPIRRKVRTVIAHNERMIVEIKAAL